VMSSGSTIPAPDMAGQQLGSAGTPHVPPGSTSSLSTIGVGGSDVTYWMKGEGQVVIFITQGLGLASAEWWPVQDPLSSRARVLTWDRPGYGDSGPPRSPRTVANVAGEALELLDAVAPEAPLVWSGTRRAACTRTRSPAWLAAACAAQPCWTPLTRPTVACARSCPPSCSGAAGRTWPCACEWRARCRAST
jgi:pimeloyl-ACP methyl ester carboxylesterase